MYIPILFSKATPLLLLYIKNMNLKGLEEKLISFKTFIKYW